MAVLARLATTLARADLALDDDRPRAVHDPGAKERKEREDRRGRVAPGAGDAPRAPDLLPVELGDAVGPAIEKARPRVRRSVPAVVVRGIAKPVVAREIDEQRGAVLELVRTVRAVGKREKEDIAAAHILVMDEGEARALAEIRVRRAYRLAPERLAPPHDVI